jgi:hypothetical protein
MARKPRRSKQSKSQKQNGSPQNTRLLQLEAEISNLKDKIKQKENTRNDSANRNSVRGGPNGWKVVNKKRPAYVGGDGLVVPS